MNVLMKTVGFSAALILIFTSVTYLLPQMKGEAPEEMTVGLQDMTMDRFVAMGEKLYRGKGNCSLCHNELGRAPDLLAFNVGKKSLERLGESRYQGAATDAESYLRESMLEPNIYVAPGFGKKGSNDTESPMPAIDKPPTQLSAVEIEAVIAYLQSKDGNTITVSLPTVPEQSDNVPDAAPAPTAQAIAASPELAIRKFFCIACHSILDSESPVGPDLRTVGQRLSVGQIRDSIVTPRAVVAAGYAPSMPEFPNMTLTELEMIVAFLATQSGDQE